MLNIIKSQSYQLKRDNFFYYALLAAGYIFFMSAVIGQSKQLLSINGATFASEWASMSLTYTVLVFVLVLACRIVGGDYNDKTVNYEILSGHSRSTIYWSRMVACFMWIIPTALILMLFPVFFLTILNGWGDNAEFWPTMLRFLLALLPVVRMICEFSLLTLIFRNCYFGMIFGFIIAESVEMSVSIIDLYNDTDFCRFIASQNMMRMLGVENARLGFVNGEDIMLYDSMPTAENVILTVCMSVGVSALCLFLGWLLTKKRDLH